MLTYAQCCVHVGEHGECECSIVHSPSGPPGPVGERGDAGMSGEFGQEGDVGDPGFPGDEGFPVRQSKRKHYHLHISINFNSSTLQLCVLYYRALLELVGYLVLKARKDTQVWPIRKVHHHIHVTASHQQTIMNSVMCTFMCMSADA